MEQNHQLCNPSELVRFLHEMDQYHQTANQKSFSVCQVSLWNGISSKPQSSWSSLSGLFMKWNIIQTTIIKAGQVCQISLWNGLSSKPQSIEAGKVPSCNGSVSPNPPELVRSPDEIEHQQIHNPSEQVLKSDGHLRQMVGLMVQYSIHGQPITISNRQRTDDTQSFPGQLSPSQADKALTIIIPQSSPS